MIGCELNRATKYCGIYIAYCPANMGYFLTETQYGSEQFTGHYPTTQEIEDYRVELTNG